MRADFDFGKREATFLVDNASLGKLAFNPQSGTRPECVSLLLQADHAIHSIVRVDKLLVRTEPK